MPAIVCVAGIYRLTSSWITCAETMILVMYLQVLNKPCPSEPAECCKKSKWQNNTWERVEDLDAHWHGSTLSPRIVQGNESAVPTGAADHAYTRGRCDENPHMSAIFVHLSPASDLSLRQLPIAADEVTCAR